MNQIIETKSEWNVCQNIERFFTVVLGHLVTPIRLDTQPFQPNLGHYMKVAIAMLTSFYARLVLRYYVILFSLISFFCDLTNTAAS